MVVEQSLTVPETTTNRVVFRRPAIYGQLSFFGFFYKHSFNHGFSPLIAAQSTSCMRARGRDGILVLLKDIIMYHQKASSK